MAGRKPPRPFSSRFDARIHRDPRHRDQHILADPDHLATTRRREFPCWASIPIADAVHGCRSGPAPARAPARLDRGRGASSRSRSPPAPPCARPTRPERDELLADLKRPCRSTRCCSPPRRDGGRGRTRIAKATCSSAVRAIAGKSRRGRRHARSALPHDGPHAGECRSPHLLQGISAHRFHGVRARAGRPRRGGRAEKGRPVISTFDCAWCRSTTRCASAMLSFVAKMRSLEGRTACSRFDRDGVSVGRRGRSRHAHPRITDTSRDRYSTRREPRPRALCTARPDLLAAHLARRRDRQALEVMAGRWCSPHRRHPAAARPAIPHTCSKRCWSERGPIALGRSNDPRRWRSALTPARRALALRFGGKDRHHVGPAARSRLRGAPLARNASQASASAVPTGDLHDPRRQWRVARSTSC